MMKSMTGFAKKQCQLTDRKITIEIKTLNSKTLDLIIKAPAIIRTKELELRSMLTRLERGKIDVYITEETDVAASGKVNEALVIDRYRQIVRIAEELGCSNEHILETVLGMSDVWTSDSNAELSDADWEIFSKTFGEAIDEVDAFRVHEGAILQQDFVKHIDLIEQMLGQIPQYEGDRI